MEFQNDHVAVYHSVYELQDGMIHVTDQRLYNSLLSLAEGMIAIVREQQAPGGSGGDIYLCRATSAAT
jgi:hypothetical protein